MACTAYVDLNPIRAAMAESLETSDYTSTSAMSQEDYLKLLDWTGRQLHRGKRGRIPASCEPVLKRLGLDRHTWCDLVNEFGKLHSRGRKAANRRCDTQPREQHDYHLRSRARELFTGSELTRSAECHILEPAFR